MKYQITNTTSGQDLGVYEGKSEAEAYLTFLLDAGQKNITDRDITPSSHGMPELIDESIEYIMTRKNDRLAGKFYQWGLPDFDKKTGGFVDEYVFIIARPSVGKTAFAFCGNFFGPDRDIFIKEEETKYMNIHTGSVGTYDEWWYEIYDDGFGEYKWRNAVDSGEVVEVVKDEDGNWIEVD